MYIRSNDVRINCLIVRSYRTIGILNLPMSDFESSLYPATESKESYTCRDGR